MVRLGRRGWGRRDRFGAAKGTARGRRFHGTWEALEDRALLALISVTSLDDGGPGSLRDAITQALGDPGSTIQIGVTGTIGLVTPLPDLSTSMTIVGPGADQLSVARGSGFPFSIFKVSSGATVTISGLSITGGLNLAGGGILNLGTLTVSQCSFSRNGTIFLPPGGDSPMLSGAGGAIANAGVLTVVDTTITGNSSSNYGGGIANVGLLTVIRSTISQNLALYGGGIANGLGLAPASANLVDSTVARNTAFFGAGGGISNTAQMTISGSTISANAVILGRSGGIDHASGTLTLLNSTISGNLALFGNAGGISNGSPSTSGPATATIVNTTITANNTVIGSGGGLDVVGGDVTLGNTLVAGNKAMFALHSDVSGALNPTSTANLIGDGTGMTGISDGSNGNQVGTSLAPIAPLLGPLADNGGPTQTHAPLPGSPVLNAGSNLVVGLAGLTTDQRGASRINEGVADIGSVESVATAGVTAATAGVTAAAASSRSASVPTGPVTRTRTALKNGSRTIQAPARQINRPVVARPVVPVRRPLSR